jgi:hypothetical protein
MQKRAVKQRSPWRRWGYRAFIILNVVGVVIAIPLLSSVVPLVRIWWDTRSQENFARRHPAPSIAPRTDVSEDSPIAAVSTHSSSALSEEELKGLTNQLKVIGSLSTQELGNIVSSQFGKKRTSGADPAKFHRESAVFHNITRKMAAVHGKQYYCYEVDLVDENGNHKTQVDYYEKPDLDYERSMATMNLVNGNPQLKKIYDAFAHVLAEKSSTNSSNASAGAKPAMRAETELSRARP